jgi:hypothetical protein
MDSLLAAVHSLGNVPARRLEDRIRELCDKALTADASELEEVFSELRSSLHEHSERLRKIMVLKLSSKKDGHPPERRAI